MGESECKLKGGRGGCKLGGVWGESVHPENFKYCLKVTPKLIVELKNLAIKPSTIEIFF